MVLLESMKDQYRNKKLILDLSFKDFRSKYVGSYFGAIWAFVQPTIMILIYWFIFQVGFRSAPVNDIPYILYFVSSIIPWFFFSESWASSTNSVTENSYLVQKIVFPVSILPTVKVLSSFYVHLFFVFFVFCLLLAYGIYPDIHQLQLIYFLVANFFLSLGLSWITSSVVIFFKDTAQIVSVFLQIAFWLTPIFYSIDMLPEKLQPLFKLMPMYYIVEGYRNTFLYDHWFWEKDLYLTFTFWGTLLLILTLGSKIFKKLSHHFADIL